jgi:hypothetical protein
MIKSGTLCLNIPSFNWDAVKLDFSLYYDIIVTETGGNDLGTINTKFK